MQVTGFVFTRKQVSHMTCICRNTCKLQDMYLRGNMKVTGLVFTGKHLNYGTCIYRKICKLQDLYLQENK